MTLLCWPLGQAVFPTLLWVDVLEGFWWRDEHHVQVKGSTLGAGRCPTGLAALTDLFFPRFCYKPVRFTREVAVSLGGTFLELLVSANVDVSGKAVGARLEAQALELRRMGYGGLDCSP